MLKICGILYIITTIFNIFIILFLEGKYIPKAYKDNKKKFYKALFLLLMYLLFSPIILSISELNKDLKKK